VHQTHGGCPGLPAVREYAVRERLDLLHLTRTPDEGRLRSEEGVGYRLVRPGGGELKFTSPWMTPACTT
jgi:hypothetical protein